jgi:AraC-like DNA-binding protein
MDSLNIVQLILGFCGVANGVFTVLLLTLYKGIGSKVKNILIAIAVALIFKITFASIVLFPDHTSLIRLIVRNLSSLGYISLGPFLILLIKEIIDTNKRLSLFDWGIFCLSIIPLYVSLYIPKYTLVAFQIYFAVNLLFAYSIIRTYKRQRGKVDNRKIGFTKNMFLYFVAIWVSASLLFVNFSLYLIELTVILTTSFYFSSYFYIKYLNNKKRKSIVKSSSRSNEKILERIESEFRNNLTFKNPNLTLPKLAKLVNVTVHQLSEAINSKGNVNYNDFVNTYRISAIINEFNYNKKTTIASIAYEFGFNSISTFNTAFKKITNSTPSEYRKHINAKNAKSQKNISVSVDKLIEV